MTIQEIRKVAISRCVALLTVLLLLTPSSLFASHFELSRLASQIDLLSSQLAFDLRYTRNYGSVRQRAVSLSREASQLVDVLGRNRSNSRVRSQFKDVRRGYEKLEQAFLRADRKDHEPQLYQEVSVLSNLFTRLSDEFYYAGYGQRDRASIYIGSRYYESPRYGPSYSGSGRWDSGRSGTSRHNSSRNGSRHSGSNARPSAGIVQHRGTAVPPVFRGNNGRADSERNDNRNNGAGGRFGNNAGTAQRPHTYDHGSRVLDRQGRQNANRRELESQARNNRSPNRVRQSSSGSRGQRLSNDSRGSERRVVGRRGGSTESRRRNHYE